VACLGFLFAPEGKRIFLGLFSGCDSRNHSSTFLKTHRPDGTSGYRLSIVKIEQILISRTVTWRLGMEHNRNSELLAELAQFTGTQGYTRITRRHLLTDGARYLADHAECYWLMDAVASHLDEIGTQDWFVLVRLELEGSMATLIYEDGNGHEHARQAIPFTDFPLQQIRLYACWDTEHWVIMLPGEY